MLEKLGVACKAIDGHKFTEDDVVSAIEDMKANYEERCQKVKELSERIREEKGLEWTFDTVASTYEKVRPSYPKELYQVLFDYIHINPNSNVVEVGSGGGQATEPILKTGCQLMAIEYGEQFSELLKDKFKEYPKFSVITGKFYVEKWRC